MLYLAIKKCYEKLLYYKAWEYLEQGADEALPTISSKGMNSQT